MKSLRENFCIISNAGIVPFYRYFNGREHFYTTNAHEIGTTRHGHRGRHGYWSEGFQGRLFTRHVHGTLPLYRYWNGRDHFYTTNHNEIGTVTHGHRGHHGYISEGTAGFCYPSSAQGRCGVLPLYRSWNGYDHFYTTDFNEALRASNSYKMEGIACYVLKP